MPAHRLSANERGAVAIEAAILLIAFVVVAATMSIGLLSTGILSAGDSRVAMTEGLSSARGTLEMVGPVIGEDSDIDGNMDEITFVVTLSAGGEDLDLTPGEAVIRYSSQSQMWDADTPAEFSVTSLESADANLIIQPGEKYEITLLGLEANLSPDLTALQKFSLTLTTRRGLSFAVTLSTPVALSQFTELR